jgi:hypothetical protein
MAAPTPKTEWVTADELSAYLASLDGVNVPDEFDVEPFVGAATAEWERRTHYSPFLNSGDDPSARLFDPPGPLTSRPIRGGSRLLRLGCGLLSLTSLKVGMDNPASATTLVSGTDFYLWPQEASYNSKPFTAVEFFAVQWGYPRSIEVTGDWGYCSDSIPYDAWLGHRDLAAGMTLERLRENYAAGPVQWEEKDTSERMSIEMLQKFGLSHLASAEEKVRAFTLLD